MQEFFKNYEELEVVIEMTGLDLKDDACKRLIKLIPDEDIEEIEDDIEFEVFKLVKSLKQEKIIKEGVLKGRVTFKRLSCYQNQHQEKKDEQ